MQADAFFEMLADDRLPAVAVYERHQGGRVAAGHAVLWHAVYRYGLCLIGHERVRAARSVKRIKVEIRHLRLQVAATRFNFVERGIEQTLKFKSHVVAPAACAFRPREYGKENREQHQAEPKPHFSPF